jgi:hypothetical protein
MTEVLEQAISHLKTFPASEQDVIASMILEELEDDLRWNKAFTDSSDVLDKLAATAMSEHRADKTQKLDPKTFSRTDWARIDAMTDKDINTSDIPPLTDEFFSKAKLRMPSRPQCTV